MSENLNPMDYDTPIKTDGDQFEIPPEGEYAFVINTFRRTVFQPRQGTKGKIKTSCPKPVFEMTIGNREGQTFNVEASLLLHESCIGLYAQFARAIGQRKHGDKETVVDWSKVPTSTGFCKVSHRTYVKADNSQGIAYDVKFCDPDVTQLSKDIAAGVVADPLTPF